MASRRAQVGLRRGGPVLIRALQRLSPLALVLVTGACFGLSEDEQTVLDVHQQNSQMYFQSGSWRQALHQADQALMLDDDLIGMRIIKGHCLTRLGSSAGSIKSLDTSVELFDSLCRGSGSDDHRSFLGAGQAHLARAMYTLDEVERIDRRLASDFLSDEGREDEEADREDAVESRSADLEAANRSLRKVMGFDLQQDNVYAMMDLVLTLIEQDETDDEVARWARQAVALLQDAVELTREILGKNMALTPRHKMDLQARVDDYLDKEAMLRDIVVTVEYNRGSLQRCLDEYEGLAARGMLNASHHYNRAGIYESLGMWAEAIDDLHAFLRQRALNTEYDDLADDVFDRIEELEQRLASGELG